MRIAPQISAGSIVALGHFNPLIFRPDWFRDNEIILGNDFESVKIEIIHPDIVSFALPWGPVQVDRDRFSITAIQEPLIRLHDFFVKCFQKLAETPISAVGINRDVHFDAGSKEAQDRVGDRLAPKLVWGDFMERGGRRLGGLRTLIMEQAVYEGGRVTRLDGSPGWIRIQVEPSLRVRNGVFTQVNDHYGLTDNGQPSDGKKAAELVAERFETSLAESETLIDRVMELTDAA